METDECNLDIPIHPIFSRENFSGFTNRQYKQLDSSLRLASHCLKLDSLLEYVATMMEGDMFVLADDNHVQPGKVDFAQIDALDKLNCEGWPETRTVRFPKPGQVLDHQMRSTCKRTLKDFAGMVKFTLNDHHDALNEAAAGPLTKQLSSQYPRGLLSVVCIPQRYFDQMIEYTREYVKCPSDYPWNQRRWLELELADVLLHELGHALQLAFQGSRCSESFYKNSVVCEAGFDITARVFGGLFAHRACRNPQTTHDHPLADQDSPELSLMALTPWPIGTGGAYNHYKFVNSKISRRWVQDQHQVATKLEPAFICAFFREEFWTNVVPTYGSGPLIPRGAPKWILMPPGPDYEFSSLYEIAHVGDPALPEGGRKRLHKIVRQRKGFQAQEDEMLLEPLRDLWSDPSGVPGGHCKMGANRGKKGKATSALKRRVK